MTSASNKPAPTQQDIARFCNVSRSTVAAVLRGNKKPSTAVIGEDTRRRVLEAADQLGYRPHSAATSLRAGRTYTLVLAVPNVFVLAGTMSAQILEGLALCAQRKGYAVTICSYSEQPDHGASFQDMLRESRFDGIVYYGDNANEHDPREQILIDMGIPHVILEKSSQKSHSLVFDNQDGVRQAVAHLLSLGRKRIAYAGFPRNAISREREAVYRAALKQAGIPIDESLILPDFGSLADNGRKAAQSIIDKQIEADAVFCAADITALACIQELSRMGVRVPHDISVMGYDDMPLASLANPALTTIRQDGHAMGEMAVSLLLEEIEQGGGRSGTVTLPVELVVRDSCGAGRRN